MGIVDYANYGSFANYGVRLLLPQRAGDYPIDTGRLRGVVDLVAAQSNRGQKLPPRQGRGIAVHRSFLSYVAVVALSQSAMTAKLRYRGSTWRSTAARSSTRIASAPSSKARRS